MINIVLFQPEIPLNTGNIARTCIATNSKLHLIKPIGFSLDDKSLKRYSASFIKDVNMNIYESFDHFVKQNNIDKIYFMTRYGSSTPSDVDMQCDKDLFLVFGSESKGIDKIILEKYKDKLIRLPMSINARSVNLSNVVMTVVYEALRQNNYYDLLRTEPHNKDYFK